MRLKGFYLAAAAGILLVAAEMAPAQSVRFGARYGRGFGHRHYRRHFHPGFGFGLGFYSRPVARPVYRNAFTADVTYAERLANDFRAAYERRGDSLGIKRDVQRMDEALERMRGEAEAYGDVTFRGSELLRDALDHAETIDRRLGSSEGELGERWHDVRRVLDRLAQTYRVR